MLPIIIHRWIIIIIAFSVLAHYVKGIGINMRKGKKRTVDNLWMIDLKNCGSCGNHKAKAPKLIASHDWQKPQTEGID